jgi:hypothetical protein
MAGQDEAKNATKYFLVDLVLYLSKYSINHKEDYYHYLSGVTQRQAWKP